MYDFRKDEKNLTVAFTGSKTFIHTDISETIKDVIKYLPQLPFSDIMEKDYRRSAQEISLKTAERNVRHARGGGKTYSFRAERNEYLSGMFAWLHLL